MSRPAGPVKEVVPKSGLEFQEHTLHPVLCKPKLLPLKSVTLEKLEKMQREAQEKVWEMEMGSEEKPKEEEERPESEEGKGQADIWTADDDPPPLDEDNNNDEDSTI